MLKIIIITLAIIAGVMFGSDLSRSVNLFPGLLIIALVLGIVCIHLEASLFVTGCVFFLILWLSITVIYLTEQQRPLAKVNYSFNKKLQKWISDLTQLFNK